MQLVIAFNAQHIR